MTKRIPLYVACVVASAALSYCEKKTGMHGMALALCLALVFCRAHPAFAVVSYAVTCGLVHFSLRYLAVVGAGVVLTLFYVFYCVKRKRRYSIWACIILFAVSQTPVFAMFCHATEEYVRAAVSLPVGAGLFYAFLATAYPVFVRGTRYGLTDKERVFAAVSAAAICAGVALFEPFGVRVAFFLWTAGVLAYERGTGESALFLAAGGGLGASLAKGDPFYLLAATAIALGAECRRAYRYLGGVGAASAFVVCAYLSGLPWSWQILAPVGAGALVGFLPEKIFRSIRATRESYRGRFALRTAANREREEVSGKLAQVADALWKAKRILEGEGRKRRTPQEIADEVRESCCLACGKYAVCREKLGDARETFAKAAASGMETGRVTYLDFDGRFTSVCSRLPRVIHVTGEYVKAYRDAQKKRTSAEEGRDLVVGTLDGTAAMLGELASAVRTGFGFDLEGEEKVREALACANVVAGDAAIYDGGEKVTLTVREGDEEKKAIGRVVSEATGRTMYAAERRAGVNGTVCLTYRPMPRFGVLYGEKSVGKEDACGDADEALKLADDKVLFVLSDGMGSGKEARRVGLDAIRLIETFYKAGFCHTTVFTCVSKLLALRDKENFSALDVAILDTRNGELDFIKQGGRESYVFSSSGVERVESNTLPMGIVEEIEPAYHHRRVSGNELVVMLSDGVADALTEADVTEIVGNLRTLNPQVVADKLVENALKKAAVKDDVTAMVFRVVRNVR